VEERDSLAAAGAYAVGPSGTSAPQRSRSPDVDSTGCGEELRALRSRKVHAQCYLHPLLPPLSTMSPIHEKSSPASPDTTSKEGGALASALAAARAAGATERTLGVYRVLQAPKPAAVLPTSLSFGSAAPFRAALAALPHARRLLADVLARDPPLATAVFALEAAGALVPGARVYLTNWLLGTVRVCVLHGRANAHAGGRRSSAGSRRGRWTYRPCSSRSR
jgi:hypothetical protein